MRGPLSHPDSAQEYAEIKRKSADEVNEDGALYREKKAPFFQKIILKAIVELVENFTNRALDFV